ncbi:Phthiocerol/phenolphthiocerol synthesis polyketide synthase type I PpsE [Serratia plymuthica]|uniref:beta-ketoacyl synthase N-terminal-like domain-containing protein n=1 Tax=Serratia plymuthica TaxID=82996 RepID=UPI00148C5DC9|nr:beta-ketoacyl synthase N-terminal-like domain-containing protein [Serratia plymuthica]QJW54951.1 Phthiocerol/phenolphthiocerol synthesis polyketide synthase type I PpsE [Serratia plymuthica]
MKDKIAVTGMSGLFPEAHNYHQFWDNLYHGRVSYQAYTDQDGHVRSKGQIPDPETFDAQRYRLSEKEALVMDPQLRKFIELVDSALLDGEYHDPGKLGTVAVIATQGSNHTYHDQLQKSIAEGQVEPPNSLLLNLNKGTDFMATRVAHIFNFQGPCFNLQSACSSSLTAIVEACWMLQTKRCDTVICGGVHISYPLAVGYKYEPGSIYSQTGICRPFDHRADGTVPSDGGGVVILRRLQDAEENGDTIHAVIANALSNNDGTNKTSYAAPSVNGQWQLLSQIYSNSAINPRQLQFIECHATGTVVGDPMEVLALSQLMDSYPVDDTLSPVVIGSVKGNIGHLFWASGIASLIKSVLALKQGVYPGTSNLSQLNELLRETEKQNLLYTADNIPLDPDKPSLAAISSMGVGGTNAHIVLEGYGKAGPQPLKKPPHKETQGSVYSFFSQTAMTKDTCGEKESIRQSPSVKQTPLTLSSLLPHVLSFYQRVLGEDEIYPDSDYFDLYGDSVTAVELLALFRSELGIDITTETIYQHSTPEALANAIVRAPSSAAQPVADRQPIDDNVQPRGLLSPYQQRFYLLEKLQRGDRSQYNVPLCVELTEAFPTESFTQTLDKILAQLPQFSHQYKITKEGVALAAKRTQIVETASLEVPAETALAVPLQAVYEQRFDLDMGPLCRVTTLQHGAKRLLVVNFHHIAIDGTGLHNLLEALSEAQGENGPLNSARIPQYRELGISNASLEFWQNALNGVPQTSLPIDPTRFPGAKALIAGTVVSRLSSERVARIQNIASTHKKPIFVVLYALFNATLSEFLDTAVVCTGMTLANRSESDRAVIDCRMNNIPVVVNCGAGEFYEILNETDTALKNSLPHAHVPLDRVSSLAGRNGQGCMTFFLCIRTKIKAMF